MIEKVYILYKKVYPGDSTLGQERLGIFLSKEEAEQAINELEIAFKANVITEYWHHANAPHTQLEYWEDRKRKYEESLARKHEGSNSWKGARRAYDTICEAITTKSYLFITPIEEWIQTRRFNREFFRIEEVGVGITKKLNY